MNRTDLDPYERWMVRSNVEHVEAGEDAPSLVATLRASGYERVAEAVEDALRPIVSVWSAYGHRFIGEDGHESCLTCGAEYDLVSLGGGEGRYQNYLGEEPSECSRDTSSSHGSDDIGEGETDAAAAGCRCNRCVA